MDRLIASNYFAAFAWATAVLLGMIGLGRVLAYAVGGESVRKAGWGLHAVWGIAVYLFVGSTLAVFGACNAMGIVLIIGAGLCAMVWTTYREWQATKEALAAFPWKLWPVWLVLTLVYTAGVSFQFNVNPSDDLPAYHAFCEKLLATGSFDEPFSWRRLASLGGHTLLQCSVIANGSFANAQAFEVALCPVILLGLIFGFRGGSLWRSPLGVLLGLVAVTTPIIRVNTASHFTGVILMVGLFVTLDLVESDSTRRLRLLAVVGLLTAAFASLRAQNVLAGCATLGIFWLASWIKERRPPRAMLTEAALLGAAMVVALLPWMIMSYRSNATPIFPLFEGNNNRDFNPQALNEGLHKRMNLPMQMFIYPALVPLFLCMLAAPAWRRGVAVRSVCIAAVLTSVVLAYTITLAPDETTVPRYVQPLLLAGAFSVLMVVAVSPRKRLLAWGVGALLLFGLPERTLHLSRCYEQLLRANKLIMPFRGKEIATYRAMQECVPEGKRILACCDYPFLFDYARNDIRIIDLPHGASPAPGLPYKKPPEEMKRYLRSQGIEYVIYVDFDEGGWLYSRPYRKQQLKMKVPLLQIMAPFMLDFFDTIEQLATTETKVAHLNGINVMQLKP